MWMQVHLAHTRDLKGLADYGFAAHACGSWPSLLFPKFENDVWTTILRTLATKTKRARLKMILRTLTPHVGHAI